MNCSYVPEKYNINDARRRWNQSHLLWYVIDPHPAEWSRTQIQRACDNWANVSHFTFAPTDILTEGNLIFRHGHYGRNGWSGQAGGPPFRPGVNNASIKINLSYELMANNPTAYERLVRHEIGHTLGLDHATGFFNLLDIMYPRFGTTFGLMYDSRRGLRELYR